MGYFILAGLFVAYVLGIWEGRIEQRRKNRFGTDLTQEAMNDIWRREQNRYLNGR